MKSLSPLVVRYALAARLGAALPVALLASSALVVGCADEKDPATWVKRLDDPAQRTAAVKRLSLFHEDAMTTAKGNKEDPKVKAIDDVIIVPLVKTYEKGGLDEKSRKDLAKALADFRDERTAPFFQKAFKEWEPNKSDEDVKYAAQSLAQLLKDGKVKDPVVLDALWDCFAKFRISQTKLSEAYKALEDAVRSAKSPSFARKAIAKIETPYDDKAKSDCYFWQLVSIRVLADLKEPSAAKALVGVLLDPAKGELRGPAVNALRGIPKEADTALIAALNGTDEAAAAAIAKSPDKVAYTFIADALGNVGTAAGRDAVVASFAKIDNDAALAGMALSLVNFPSDPKAETAFLDVYKKIGDETLLQTQAAKGTLMNVSANLYDVKIVDWAIKEGTTTKASEGTAEAIKGNATNTILRLFDDSQKKAAEDAVNKLGLPADKAKFATAAKLVDSCKSDAACYAKVLDEPIVGAPDQKFRFVKATYMAAALGNDATRATLGGKLETVKDDAIRIALALAIDHLAPKGDAQIANTMDKIVQANVKSPAPSDDTLVKIAAKLRARAL
jgi:hypothetical protein